MWMIFYVVELSTASGMWAYSDGSMRNMELPKVSCLGFSNDYKMIEISVDKAVQVALELKLRMKTGI